MRCGSGLLLLFIVSCLVAGVFAQAENERVVGGQQAKKYVRKHLTYVWIVTEQGVFTCTGTVIGRRYVLTAAHCFDNIRNDDSIVFNSFLYVGIKTAEPDFDDRFYYFDAVYVHKKYRSDDFSLRNDIAIIKLSSKIRKKEYHPITLGKEPKQDTVVIGAGYGVLDESGTPARYAMQTNLIAKSFKTCRSYETWIKPYLRKKLHVCAVSIGFPDEGKTDTCYGDSGGPLLRKKGKKVVQYGITSFGTSGCASVGGTPWYVRVSTFRKDIQKVVKRGSSPNFKKYV